MAKFNYQKGKETKRGDLPKSKLVTEENTNFSLVFNCLGEQRTPEEREYMAKFFMHFIKLFPKAPYDVKELFTRIGNRLDSKNPEIQKKIKIQAELASGKRIFINPTPSYKHISKVSRPKRNSTVFHEG